MIAGLIMTYHAAKADDFTKGMKGQTNEQADMRSTYSINEKSLVSRTQNLIGKYWDKKIWAFVNVPYKSVNGSQGLGDISAGIGPRCDIDSLHVLTYAGVNIPTGNFTQGLGNGRVDGKAGIYATYFNGQKNFDVDLANEYTMTGENHKGINLPNEFYSGIFVAKGITPQLRLGAGLTSTFKGSGDNEVKSRLGVRWTFSKKFHMEILYDKTLGRKNIPYSNSVQFIARCNI